MKSGSKSGPTDDASPELERWQAAILAAIARSATARSATFGGATALAAVYLHHRQSEDIDLFSPASATEADIRVVTAAGRKLRMNAEVTTETVRTMVVLRKAKVVIGHVDFATFPYDPIDRPVPWRGLRVDSLIDMVVNKVQAVLTRARPRDYVDLWFLLREGPERDLDRLLTLARSKFETGASRVTLAERLARVARLTDGDLPKMLRPAPLDEMRRFFEGLARDLVRRGP